MHGLNANGQKAMQHKKKFMALPYTLTAQTLKLQSATFMLLNFSGALALIAAVEFCDDLKAET